MSTGAVRRSRVAVIAISAGVLSLCFGLVGPAGATTPSGGSTAGAHSAPNPASQSSTKSRHTLPPSSPYFHPNQGSQAYFHLSCLAVTKRQAYANHRTSVLSRRLKTAEDLAAKASAAGSTARANYWDRVARRIWTHMSHRQVKSAKRAKGQARINSISSHKCQVTLTPPPPPPAEPPAPKGSTSKKSAPVNPAPTVPTTTVPSAATTSDQQGWA